MILSPQAQNSLLAISCAKSLSIRGCRATEWSRSPRCASTSQRAVRAVRSFKRGWICSKKDRAQLGTLGSDPCQSHRCTYRRLLCQGTTTSETSPLFNSAAKLEYRQPFAFANRHVVTMTYPLDAKGICHLRGHGNIRQMRHEPWQLISQPMTVRLTEQSSAFKGLVNPLSGLKHRDSLHYTTHTILT